MEALEAACLALQAPPSGPDGQRKRAEAEAVLDHFKRSPHALQDAMAMIQRTPHPVVQFHCVATIREVTLKKWSALTMADKSQSLDFLMQFLWQHYAQLPHYVSGAMLQAVVLLMKRGWLERASTERDAIIQQMGNMLNASSSDDAASITTRLIAAKWLHAFVTEFSSASRASAMFQPVEFHTKSRKSLEKQGLKELLGFAVQLLEDLIRTTTMCSTPDASSGSNLLDVPKQQLELLETAFMLCVEILNWNFQDAMGNLTWSLSASADAGDSTRAVITPQTSWRDVLVRPELIHAAFNTYAFFRNLATRNETLLHLARQFLIQLASLQGPMFARKTEQVGFLSEIFRGTSALIHNPFLDLIGKTDYAGYEIATRELIDMCQLLFRLVSNVGLTALVASPIFASVLEEMSSLSCKLLTSALERIQQHLRLRNHEPVDDLWQLEGVDILLDAWVALANDPFLDAATPDADVDAVAALVSKFAAPVVELYLQTQLELCAVDALAEQDENEDVEDDSASSLREQVELAAALARMNAASSSTLLLNLLQSFVAGIQQATAALNGRDEMTPELSQLIEKLHFTVLFSGLFLADEYVSERPCIPQRIHAAVHAKNGREPAPQVLNLLLLLLSQLLEFEANRVVQNPTSVSVSPFFSEQLFSTITRICATYLAPDALAHDGEIAPELLEMFGFQHGGRAGELVNFIVQQCTAYLLHWPTQPVVMQNLMEFLLVLSKTNAISCVLHSSFWQSLVQANASAGTFLSASGASGDPLRAAVARIPSARRGQLTEALCRAGMTSDDSAMCATHFDAVARPVEARLQALIALPNFESKQTANDVRVQEELKLILEMYTGIARASESYVSLSVSLCRAGCSLTSSLPLLCSSVQQEPQSHLGVLLAGAPCDREALPHLPRRLADRAAHARVLLLLGRSADLLPHAGRRAPGLHCEQRAHSDVLSPQPRQSERPERRGRGALRRPLRAAPAPLAPCLERLHRLLGPHCAAIGRRQRHGCRRRGRVCWTEPSDSDDDRAAAAVPELEQAVLHARVVHGRSVRREARALGRPALLDAPLVAALWHAPRASRRHALQLPSDRRARGLPLESAAEARTRSGDAPPSEPRHLCALYPRHLPHGAL